MTKKSASSKRWLQRQRRDIYTKKAAQHNLPSRASFKLTAINEQFQLFDRAHLIIELGASPGGWSHVITNALARKGHLIAIDRLPMRHSSPHMTFIHSDITDGNLHATMQTLLHNRKADGIVSDLSPNISGIKDKDHNAQMVLCRLASDWAQLYLDENGFLLTKVTQGDQLAAWLDELKNCFRHRRLIKPAASRTASREQYMLARAFTPSAKRGKVNE